MRLVTIAESYLGKLRRTADYLGISPSELESSVNKIDPSGKYGIFILKLIANKNVRVPEDNIRIKEAINNFVKYKHKLDIKDINKYNSLHDIETSVEPHLGSKPKRKGGLDINISSLPGVEVVNRYKNFTTIMVTDPESLKQIGEGTKWCTRGSYANCQAEAYINEYDAIYVVLEDNVPIIQYTPDFEQVMDRDDISLSIHEPIDDIDKIIPLENNFLYQEAMAVATDGRGDSADLHTLATIVLDYALNVIQRELPPKYEKYIIQSPSNAYYYARQFKGRWPEAEPVIIQEIDSLVYYAISVLKGRWLEAEPRLLEMLEEKSPYVAATWATMYAKLAVRSRWPEGENYIFNSIEHVAEYKHFLGTIDQARGDRG